MSSPHPSRSAAQSHHFAQHDTKRDVETSYDAAGRLDTVTIARGSYDRTYHATTGQLTQTPSSPSSPRGAERATEGSAASSVPATAIYAKVDVAA